MSKLFGGRGEKKENLIDKNYNGDEKQCRKEEEQREEEKRRVKVEKRGQSRVEKM